MFTCFSQCDIVYPVVEDEDTKIPGEDGENITIPVNMAMPNPNGAEFDNLYLDMNGIVSLVQRHTSSLALSDYLLLGSSMHAPGRKGNDKAVYTVAIFLTHVIQPAPETEEEMMIEIFQYTERVVNMIRPRKLLFMAIGKTFLSWAETSTYNRKSDGVAPRAKMNQQRSRRFRSSQEAKDKEDARKESVLLWEGKFSNFNVCYISF